MSIDYDRLRELLEQWQHGDEVRDQLEAQWDIELAAPDLARELLRMRQELANLRWDLTYLRNLMWTQAGNLQRSYQSTAADYVLHNAHRLNRIIQGDTE